jgi:hypothetical protein
MHLTEMCCNSEKVHTKLIQIRNKTYCYYQTQNKWVLCFVTQGGKGFKILNWSKVPLEIKMEERKKLYSQFFFFFF